MIRGNKRPVPAKIGSALSLDFRASIHNRFDIEVIDAASGEVKQRARGFNVICDALWDRLFYVSNSLWCPKSYFNYVLYGEGSGTPSASDTELFSKIGAIAVTHAAPDYFPTIVQDRENGLVSAQAVVVLQAADAVGETITEVGIGYDNTHVVTHALLQDMNGNPISITKTSTDVIKIYATIFVHWPAAAWYGGTINLAKATFFSTITYYNYLGTLCGYDYTTSYAFFAALGHAGRSVVSSELDYDRVFTTTVNAQQKKVSMTYRMDATSFNDYPIRMIQIGSSRAANASSNKTNQSPTINIVPGSWISIPSITGEAIGTGDGTTVDFITKFPVKSGAVVKVNGAAASGVTVRTGAPDGTKLGLWVNPVSGVTSAGVPVYESNFSGRYSSGEIRLTAYNGDERLFENPFYSAGIAALNNVTVSGSTAYSRSVSVYVSDDCESWTLAGSISRATYETWEANQSIAIPSNLQNKRYFKVVFATDYTGSYTLGYFISAAGANPETNVHFTAAPAAGSVITIDYEPDCIPKDENHVLDITIELTLGEHQE